MFNVIGAFDNRYTYHLSLQAENEKGNCYYLTHLAFTEPKCFEEQVRSIIHMYYTYISYWEKSKEKNREVICSKSPKA